MARPWPLFYVAALLLFCISAASGETVVLNDGSRIEGKVNTSELPDRVVVSCANGARRILRPTDIREVHAASRPEIAGVGAPPSAFEGAVAAQLVVSRTLRFDVLSPRLRDPGRAVGRAQLSVLRRPDGGLEWSEGLKLHPDSPRTERFLCQWFFGPAGALESFNFSGNGTRRSGEVDVRRQQGLLLMRSTELLTVAPAAEVWLEPLAAMVLVRRARQPSAALPQPIMVLVLEPLSQQASWRLLSVRKLDDWWNPASQRRHQVILVESRPAEQAPGERRSYFLDFEEPWFTFPLLRLEHGNRLVLQTTAPGEGE